MTQSIVINFANTSEYSTDVIGKYIHIASANRGLPIKFSVLSYIDDGLPLNDSNKVYNRVVEDVYLVENIETTLWSPYNSLAQVTITMIKNESGQQLIEVGKRKDLVDSSSTPHAISHVDIFLKLLGVRATVTVESFFEDVFVSQPYLSRSKTYTLSSIEEEFYRGYYNVANLDSIYGNGAPLSYKKNGSLYYNTTDKKLKVKSGSGMVDAAGREALWVDKGTASKILNSLTVPVYILITITGIPALFELRNGNIIKLSGGTINQRDHYKFYKDNNGGLYLLAGAYVGISVIVFGTSVNSTVDYQANVSTSGLTYISVKNQYLQNIGYNTDDNVPTSGNTRPSFNIGSVDGSANYVGFMFFDTSLSPTRPVWWNGAKWVNYDGTDA